VSRAAKPPPPAGPYLVVGLARSGIAASLMLAERGERVIGVDASAPAGLAQLAGAGVELHPNEDGIALLDGTRTVVKSPGVPRQAPVVARALAESKPVLGELELGWRLLENETIAVTGTNGKTTTVEWIGHIHRVAGLPVAVAGNVGNALTGLVGNVEPEVTIVCEASSFQLEDTVAFAPEAAVLLNIAPDHLDRHLTFAAYRDAKLALFARQSPDDLAVAPVDIGIELPGAARRVTFGEQPGRDGGPGSASVTPSDRCASVTLRDEAICWQGAPLLPARELSLRGRHNLDNGMAAAAVCLARGIDRGAVREGLRTFAGVAHRLEELARRDGVLYVNDSKATNVASTLVALDTFAGEGIHLILGGQGKGQDFTALRAAVAEARCRAVYLIGEDAPAIAGAMRPTDAEPGGGGARESDQTGVAVHACGDLEHALTAAARAARPGEVVLLSPACASFDQFADYEARGERFRELVAA
jgi:UDP-N-acetylmuramoylalanine--D-glutamate ligase